MKSLTFTSNDGTRVPGHIPESWEDVPLSSWIKFHADSKGKPKGMESLILASCLTELPGNQLEKDVSLVPVLLAAMPWVTHLPEPEPLPFFQHGRKLYEYVGNLEKVDAGQFEAMLSFLEGPGTDHIEATPNLLAVLYKEQGIKQDSLSVAAAAEAFQSLPVSKAWPAISFFLTSSARSAITINSFSQVQKRILTMTEVVQKAIAVAPPSQTRSSRTLAWLASRYIRSVREMLARS